MKSTPLFAFSFFLFLCILTAQKTQVFRALKIKNFPNEAIAAIMGNIEVETGGSFDYRQKQRGGNGYGLFQFDFQRPYYEKYLRNHGKVDSVQSQIDYMYEAIYGIERSMLGLGNAKQIAKALQSRNIREATVVFSDKFERPGVPHLDRRIKQAEAYYQRIQKAQEL